MVEISRNKKYSKIIHLPVDSVFIVLREVCRNETIEKG
jgi:hypothetical protein